MIQAIIKKGKVFGEQIPAPVASKGCILIKVVNSCISAGTEMSVVSASGKSLIMRAMEQPANVAKAFNMIRSDGIARSYKKIMCKLGSSNPTGYSISGIVIGLGEGTTHFKIGDEIAAAGAGLANHAEYVDVPENLVMPIPKGLSFINASTVTLGGISLQGVRRADVSIGEFCVVVGAGILGLLSVQMLRQSGVRVIVVDINPERLEVARELGAEIVINATKEDPVKLVENYTGGYGTDAVLFTAATSSSEPLSQAFKMCKKKGRVVLVGVVGMEIKREDIYTKELDFLISTSYGPGRYDKNYEEKGLDYPYSYIRWTENRNMEEYLRLVHIGAIKLEKLINKIFPIADVNKAFESLNSSVQRPLMVVLDYGKPEESKMDEYLYHDRKVQTGIVETKKNIVNIGLIGAGNFTASMHLPNIEKMNDKYRLYAVMDRVGHRSKTIADQYKAAYATTNFSDIINDPKIDLVFISTQHDSHADLTVQALRAGKNVFVEKPLATNQKDLDRIKEFYQSTTNSVKPVLMVGFNRRFSRYAQEIKKHIDQRINPLVIHYRMNAGYIPLDHWVHEHGGRIVGEGCHIIDLMTYFTAANILSVSVESLTPKTSKYSSSDNQSFILKYDDGSICSIDYFSVGNKEIPKEMMEIHFDEKSIIMNDYKSLSGHGVTVSPISTSVSEKGHFEELEILYQTLKQSGSWPIELWDLVQTTEVSIQISEGRI
jgi:predicted dehydrogenase/threonine dehydrogenase-like Zn-dependent dehydrogenase